MALGIAVIIRKGRSHPTVPTRGGRFRQGAYIVSVIYTLEIRIYTVPKGVISTQRLVLNVGENPQKCHLH